MAAPAPAAAGQARQRKPRSDEQREAENERRRMANETEEARAKREERNLRRRVGGDLHKKLTPEARLKKKDGIFDKRHAANPEMRTNKPRRKFKNARASWTNVDDVYKLRHDFANQAQALKAMTRRAEAAEARAEAEKGAREAAEARSEAEKGAREAAERKLALQEGAELSAYELYGLYRARLGSQTEGAVQTEGAGATAEAAQAANLAGRARRDAARDERLLKRARRNGLEEHPECAEYLAWQNSPHTKGLEARAETAEANLQKIREDSTDWANAVGLTPLLLTLARRLGREPTKEEVKECLESLAA